MSDAPKTVIAKVVADCKQKEIAQLLRTPEMKGCKGFVLSESEDDRLKDVITVSFVWSKTAVILVNDYDHMLEYAVKYHIKINSHHKMVGMKRGFNRDDFAYKKMTALITFEF